jgi:ribonuclease VapC
MFLDASAIIAILARENEGTALAARLGQATRVQVSPIAIYEAVLGLARIGNISLTDARGVLDRFLEEVGAETIPITDTIGAGALRAFDRFGKGRHPAALNLGDCFAYACAEELRTELLFKGEDFPLTDVGELGA